jgi:hypothetical protein
MKKVSIYEVYKLHDSDYFVHAASNLKAFTVSKYAYPCRDGFLFVSSTKMYDERLYFLESCDSKGNINLLRKAGDLEYFYTEKAATKRILEIIGEQVNEASKPESTKGEEPTP